MIGNMKSVKERKNS